MVKLNAYQNDKAYNDYEIDKDSVLYLKIFDIKSSQPLIHPVIADIYCGEQQMIEIETINNQFPAIKEMYVIPQKHNQGRQRNNRNRVLQSDQFQQARTRYRKLHGGGVPQPVRKLTRIFPV